MAKKNFKGGIGDLLQESITNSTNEQNNNDEKLLWLENQLEMKDYELMKWRTGQLTVDIFHKTLAESNLKYIASTNSFEILR